MDTLTYPFWQQVSREAVAQVKSQQFRDQFFKLVCHDEIHIRLLSLHLYLLSAQVKNLRLGNFKNWDQYK